MSLTKLTKSFYIAELLSLFPGSMDLPYYTSYSDTIGMDILGPDGKFRFFYMNHLEQCYLAETDWKYCSQHVGNVYLYRISPFGTIIAHLLTLKPTRIQYRMELCVYECIS